MLCWRKLPHKMNKKVKGLHSGEGDGSLRTDQIMRAVLDAKMTLDHGGSDENVKGVPKNCTGVRVGEGYDC